MDYESFVAYSSMAIVCLLGFLFVRWMDKCWREQKKRHEEFEKRRKEIEDAIRREWELRKRDGEI